jgi:hypothetical protein
MRRSLPFATTLLLTACAGGGQPAASGAAAPAPAARAAADPARLAYTPGTARYQLESRTHTSQEMMGQVTEIEGTTMLLVSSAMTAQGDHLAAAFTIDSVASTSSMPGGESAILAARGRTIRAIFSVLGSPVPGAASDSAAADPLTAQLEEQFREFLPALPAAAIARGYSWTDTVTADNNLGEIQMSSRSVRTHLVMGWEGEGPDRALHLQTTGNYTVTGSGSTQGQELTLEGSGSTVLERFVSARGQFLRGTTQDSSAMMVTVVSMGLEIPVRSNRRSTITRLP